MSINFLTRNKLEYKHRETVQRNNSFKGRDYKPLFVYGDERAEFNDRLYNPDPIRPISRN